MALNIPGVLQQREYRRYYPAGEVMAHVVGFTGIDDSGQEGIELAQQAWLAGMPGSRKVIKDRKGRIVEDVESLKVPRDGREIYLSIDQRLQFLAHRELKAAVAAGVVALGMLVWAEKVLVGAPSLLPLFLTREGQYLLALGVALLLCIGAVALVDLWPARWSLWVLGATGVAAVLVHVLAGHAASPSSVWLLNVVVQWVHMAAVGVWVGGLFWLLLGLRDRDPRGGARHRAGTGAGRGGVRECALRHRVRDHPDREGRAGGRAGGARRAQPLLLGAGGAR
jgi:hypothetical protein